jgi:hypothetical protein
MAVALLLSAVLPVLTPSFVAADQVSGRSIALSSSVADASNVTYQVKFTPVQAAGAFVIDLCSDTPLIGAACGTSTGLVVTGADTDSAGTTAGVTDVTGTGHQIIVTVPMSAGVEVSLNITGIHNPSAAGPLFARILTYTNATAAGNYASADPDNGGADLHKDDGGVALSITNNIGVSGAVLETLSFCISGANSGGNNIAAGCTGTLTPPTLELGELSGSVKALSSSAVSTGSIYTQISTNAVSGAVVRLKSDSTGCGGLSRIGAASIAAGCGILPANTANGYGITAGQAKFGVVTTTATDEGTASGAYQPAASSGYGTTNYALNWAADNLTGVTSPYGDPFLDTNNAPVNNKEMQLTFGASINDSTPAGKYSANLSLIATGKF